VPLVVHLDAGHPRVVQQLLAPLDLAPQLLHQRHALFRAFGDGPLERGQIVGNTAKVYAALQVCHRNLDALAAGVLLQQAGNHAGHDLAFAHALQPADNAGTQVAQGQGDRRPAVMPDGQRQHVGGRGRVDTDLRRQRGRSLDLRHHFVAGFGIQQVSGDRRRQTLDVLADRRRNLRLGHIVRCRQHVAPEPQHVGEHPMFSRNRRGVDQLLYPAADDVETAADERGRDADAERHDDAAPGPQPPGRVHLPGFDLDRVKPGYQEDDQSQDRHDEQ